jgi:DNA-binding YbaB/EbfC family protein
LTGGDFIMMGNMGKMMKQVQKMQADMAKLQEELVNRTVEASAGGGVIKVVASGKQEILSIQINPEAVDPDDVEMLQDMIMAAVNEALRQSQDMVSQEMSKITGGMNIPGLF